MDQELRAWMDVLIEYAEDWDRTFRASKRKYFTQEYWYLFTACTKAYLEERPLTVSAAATMMRAALSENARMTRIQKAVTDGFLIKKASPVDLRETLVVPTPQLIRLLSEHLTRTLARTRSVICLSRSE